MPKSHSDLIGKSPLYAALFQSSQDISTPYMPYVEVPKTSKGIFGVNDLVTIPHGLSREMAAALPGLWYCMHLPNIFPQLADMSFEYLKASQSLSLEHHFFFAPVQVFNRDYIRDWPPWALPALAVCPDSIIEEVRKNAEELGFPLPAVPYSELSDTSLAQHWRAMHEFFCPTFHT